MKTLKKCLSLLLTLLMVLPCATGVIGSAVAYAAALEDTNVALGKSVMVSAGSGESAVTDGNTDGGYWDSGDIHPADVTVDLGGYYKLSSISVYPYYGAPTRYYHYTIEVSPDGISYEQVAAKTTNETETAAGSTYDIGTLDKTARFVRVTMLENSANPSLHLHEIKVMGHEDKDYEPGHDVPVVEDPNDANNIAFSKPTRANSNSGFSRLVVNGNTTDSWSGVGFPRYVDIDLMKNYDVSDVTVFTPASGTYQYVIYTSLDGVNFTKQVTSELAKGTKAGTVHTFAKPVTCRVIRVNVIANNAGGYSTSSLCEVRVHGTENTTAPVTPTREKMEFKSHDQWLKEQGIKADAAKPGLTGTYTAADTVKALEGLITRILGEQYVSWFTFSFADAANGNDYFTVETSGSKTKITANNGVSAATGLNYYLKYYCNVEVSQQTSQVKMPATMPKVEGKATRETPLKVRYAYNYCTLSYTMPFYGYEEWQRELDYLMLSGVNLILDTTATEALWVAYLQKYGYTAYEALDFVCGYAYKAWWLMGNLEGYGGNVSDSWVYDTLEMARVNQRYMTVMGAQPCLQAFVGTLPIEFGTKAAKTLTDLGFDDPKSYMTGTGGWAGFTRPYVINTTYNGYERLARDFYETQKELYGDVTDYYAGDFFHEIDSPPPAVFNKAEMAAKVLDCMTAYDKTGVWILQAWWSNPLPEVLKGFGDKRNTNVLILDLSSAASPKYTNTTTWGGREFGGTDWVFSILDNYGGRTGVHGTLDRIAKDIANAKKTSKYMKGIGITPEGTEQNPVVYELYWEAAWCDEPIDVKEWIKGYVTRRYGAESESAQKAWQLFIESDGIYTRQTADGTGVNYAMNNNPSLTDGSCTGSYFSMPYNEIKFQEGVDLLLEDFDKLADSPSYVYDAVAFTRQMLSGKNIQYFSDMKDAINAGNAVRFAKYSNLFLETMRLIDEISAYDQDSLFGEWIGKIDRWCADERTGEYDDYGKDMMYINAKALVTVWASIPLYNYAYRQYNGLMTDYYIPLWEQLCKQVQNTLDRGGKPSDSMRQLSSQVCFRQAWSVVTNSEREYITEALPAKGDPAKNIRSLKEICEQARKYHAAAGSNSSNLALAGSAYAQNNNGSLPSYLNDGNPSGGLWIASSPSCPVYAGINLGSAKPVKIIRIVAETRAKPGDNVMNYYVEAKVNGKFRKIYTGQTFNTEDKTYTTTITLDEAIMASDIRVTLTSNGGIWPALNEIELYADELPRTSEVIGDVDGDGDVDVKDVTAHILALEGKGSYVAENLDVNGDGAVNTKDTSRLLQHLADDKVEIF